MGEEQLSEPNEPDKPKPFQHLDNFRLTTSSSGVEHVAADDKETGGEVHLSHDKLLHGWGMQSPEAGPPSAPEAQGGLSPTEMRIYNTIEDAQKSRESSDEEGYARSLTGLKHLIGSFAKERGLSQEDHISYGSAALKEAGAAEPYIPLDEEHPEETTWPAGEAYSTELAEPSAEDELAEAEEPAPEPTDSPEPEVSAEPTPSPEAVSDSAVESPWEKRGTKDGQVILRRENHAVTGGYEFITVSPAEAKLLLMPEPEPESAGPEASSVTGEDVADPAHRRPRNWTRIGSKLKVENPKTKKRLIGAGVVLAVINSVAWAIAGIFTGALLPLTLHRLYRYFHPRPPKQAKQR